MEINKKIFIQTVQIYMYSLRQKCEINVQNLQKKCKEFIE